MRARLPSNGPLAIRRRSFGYFAEGPGFYVWDEDPGEVARLAHDLGRGSRPEASGPRLPAPPAGVGPQERS